MNKIVKDDGFDNCYNFIKDIVVTMSRFYQVAIKLLLLIDIDNSNDSNKSKQKNNIFKE